MAGFLCRVVNWLACNCGARGENGRRVHFVRRDPKLSLDSSAGLIVSSLEVWRGERRLFGDLSFELRPGQVALITGPNGAGKTSLLRILAGLSEPVAGAVTWRGTPVRQLAAELRDRARHLKQRLVLG